AVNPITRTENLPSFFASTSCANSSVLPCSVTSSSWVPAAKLRWETLRTPRTRCESAARKSVAIRKEGTLRTVTWMSLPEETSLDQRAAIFLIMSWPNARDAFLIASFPQETSSSCAAPCVASAVLQGVEDGDLGDAQVSGDERALAPHPDRARGRHADVLLGDQHHRPRHPLAGHQEAHRLQVLVELGGADERAHGDLHHGPV